MFRPRLVLLVVAAALGLGSCFADRGSLAAGGMTGGGATDSVGGMPAQGGDGGAGPVCVARAPVEGATCRPVESAEPLYLRLVNDEPQDVKVFVDDLFVQFKAHCGSCHVDTNLGDMPFQASSLNFSRNVDDRSLKAIRSNTAECNNAPDCINYMPPAGSPTGKPWSERESDENDAVLQFATLLEEWIKQDRPADYFVCGAACAKALPAGKGYPVTEEFAASLTNMGSCIPDAGMVGTEAGESCDLDATFAALEKNPTSDQPHEKLGLPITLEQTDLFSLDSAVLAPFGVIAYAPTYPLWSDHAGKLRHVRVPRGESIRYNRETKQLDIPTNTRFYKTFLKEVIAADGKKRFRKIETRIIVSRGSESLFGTYEWNDAETQATLVTSPLRSGEPFTDVLKILIVDEPKAAEIQALKDAGQIRNYTYELDAQHAVRRYAIPGSERCIQCHQGSESFILGFSPLQVNRRECKKETLEADGHCQGGILEPAGADEVNQLDRLISYGVITGFDPSVDIARLEDPQGSESAPRPHRTAEELVAQGYVLGNCAHCHNPLGYPTKLNPELGELLDFLPSEKGGIFGFPLDRYSPRVKRGAMGDIQLPYITPSLRDIVPAGASSTTGLDKWVAKQVIIPSGDPLIPPTVAHIDAPWRSLIYRNVDTPFTYTDNYAIYPHMPLNTAGFDCRAPRILGEWMVSIPAVRKNPALSEELETGDPRGAESDPQPYVEVAPNDTRFPNAQIQATKRLETYRMGTRYATYCPDTSDIVDIDVLRGKRTIPEDGTWKAPGGGFMVPLESVPDRSHWVVTDLSDPPGQWNPRRTDWQNVFVQLQALPATADQAAKDAWAAEKEVLDMAKGLTISQKLRDFANQELKFGVWQVKPECAGKLASKPKLSELYSDPARPRWVGLFDPFKQNPELPIFTTKPGAAVYNMICVNCHGPDADSQGRQATTLQDMTGGTGRVANFRNGLFGPAGSGGENRNRVFSTEDQAARYLAWMALGGTRTKIPQGILDLVANTQVLGMNREQFNSSTKTANMLQVAQNLCLGVGLLGVQAPRFQPAELSREELADSHVYTGLITKNGDAELWKKLCTIDNPAPIRVSTVIDVSSGEPSLFPRKEEFYRPQAYPPNQAVGNEYGGVEPNLTPENAMPWCVRLPTDPILVAWLQGQKGSDGKPLPVCPTGLLVEANRFATDLDPSSQPVYTELNRWAARGAINAGFAVFLFLDELVGKGQERAPRYNECELLPD